LDFRNLPLLVAAVVFALFLLWRLRPSIVSTRGKSSLALREAKKKIEAATDDLSRATALAEAGGACAELGRTTGAVGYFLRAMRADPSSADLVNRAAAALARRPHALEALLWRRLGSAPWADSGRGAALAALAHLAALYAGPIHHRPRARALAYAIAALGGEPPAIAVSRDDPDLD
jgi:hypothetical protein